MALRDGSPGEDAGWASLAAGAASVESLTALVGVDPAGLSGSALVDAVLAAEKALSLLSAVQIRLQAALAVPFTAGDPMPLAARLARKSCAPGDQDQVRVVLFVDEAAVSLAGSEIAAALRISPITAGIRVRDAQAMTTVLAPTLTALQAGVLDRGKSRVISEHCAPLSGQHTAAVQHLVLPRAGDLSTGELRELTGRAVITVDPDGAAERHEHAAARRALALTALPDAMACLRATLPADGAVKIFQLSDLLATGTAGNPTDPRGISARRVDAWVDIAEQLLTHGHLDLTGYLGAPLPDHGTPPPPRPHHPTSTDTDTRSGTERGGTGTERGGTGTERGGSKGSGTCTGGGDPFTPGDTGWAASDDPIPEPDPGPDPIPGPDTHTGGAGQDEEAGSAVLPPAAPEPANTQPADRTATDRTATGRAERSGRAGPAVTDPAGPPTTPVGRDRPGHPRRPGRPARSARRVRGHPRRHRPQYRRVRRDHHHPDRGPHHRGGHRRRGPDLPAPARTA